MKKRTEHFVQKPSYFEIVCHKCGSEKTDWSEFESHIWCYDCKEDIELKNKYDIFPVICARIIGFDLRRWDMVNKCIIEE